MSSMVTTRPDLYGVLSAWFAQPTAEFVAQFRDPDMVAELADAAARMPGGGVAAAEAADAIRRLPAEMGGVAGKLEAIEVEYTRLFLGPGRPVAVPYESVYVLRDPEAKEGTLGQVAGEVADAYRLAGLAPIPGGDPPDHLAAELEFMAFMAEAAEDGPGAEVLAELGRSFLDEHLLTWAPTVAQTVIAEARHPFYRVAGVLLAAVLEAERELSA